MYDHVEDDDDDNDDEDENDQQAPPTLDRIVGSTTKIITMDA